MLKLYSEALIAWIKELPEQLGNMVCYRRDDRFYPELWICVLFALLVVPAGKYCPVEYGYENGVVENTQMVLLFIGMVLCWFAKKNRVFFRLLSSFIFILILRETNFGKTVFYPDPEVPNKFLKWKDIPYAPYVDPVMILYVIGMAVYFFRKKLYLPIAGFVKKGKFPLPHFAFMAASVIAGRLVDKLCHNFVAEEMIELVFYTAFVCASGVPEQNPVNGCRTWRRNYCMKNLLQRM